MDLEEQGFHQRLSRRTLKQKMTLYVLRVLLNVLVLVLLAGSFCMIFFATQYSKEKKEPNVVNTFTKTNTNTNSIHLCGS